jgi:hypothetical protein
MFNGFLLRMPFGVSVELAGTSAANPAASAAPINNLVDLVIKPPLLTCVYLRAACF